MKLYKCKFPDHGCVTQVLAKLFEDCLAQRLKKTSPYIHMYAWNVFNKIFNYVFNYVFVLFKVPIGTRS